MNENLDLTKILEGCPKGTKFYSIIHGEITFKSIQYNTDYPIRFDSDAVGGSVPLTREGKAIRNAGECIVFPSKVQRDWSKFERFWDKPKKERFNPKTLKPFDKVLVKYSLDCDFDWECDLFSHIDNKDDEFPYHCIGANYRYCIPYNDDTKHLIGTSELPSKYYRYWEE